MIAEGMNRYGHASFLIFLTYFNKIKFFDKAFILCIILE